MYKLSKIKDDHRFYHLKFRPVSGLIFATLGFAFSSISYWKEGTYWGSLMPITIFGSLFTIIGIVASFYRTEVRIDKSQRRYQLKRGFWPKPNEYSGSLNDLKIKFDKHWNTSQNNTSKIAWSIGILVPEIAKKVEIWGHTSESEARAFFEKLCQRLSVEGIDTTAESPIVRHREQMDESIASRPLEFDQVDERSPPGDLIYKITPSGIAYIQTPIGPLNRTTFTGVLFGLPFFLMGAFCLFIGLGLHEVFEIEIKVSGPLAIALFIGAIFTAIGGLIIVASIGAGYTKRVFSYSDNSFIFQVFTFGKLTSEQIFNVREIEEFGLRNSTTNGPTNSFFSKNKENSKKGYFELYVRTKEDSKSIPMLKYDEVLFLKNVFLQKLLKSNQYEPDIKSSAT